MLHDNIGFVGTRVVGVAVADGSCIVDTCSDSDLFQSKQKLFSFY